MSDKLLVVDVISDRFSATVTLDTAGVSLPTVVLSAVPLWPTKLPGAQVRLVWLVRLWHYLLNSRVYLWHLIRLKEKSLHWKSGSAQKQVLADAVDAPSLGNYKTQLDDALRKLI